MHAKTELHPCIAADLALLPTASQDACRPAISTGSKNDNTVLWDPMRSQNGAETNAADLHRARGVNCMSRTIPPMMGFKWRSASTLRWACAAGHEPLPGAHALHGQ